MVTDDGDAEIVKLPETTVNVTIVLCWMPPPVPVTVIGYVPSFATFMTVMVMVEVPAPGASIVLGLKATKTPAGWPEAESDTPLLNPSLTVVVIVDVPFDP